MYAGRQPQQHAGSGVQELLRLPARLQAQVPEAGQRYYELSYNTQVVVEDRLNTLECAVICTVLAAAGGANA